MPRRPPGSETTSVWHRPPPSRRQPQTAFGIDEITRAAIELADTDGLAAVSMRRVAARIGAAPTSLYWYFSNKDQLFELMVDAVTGEIELPEQPSGDWRADLTAIAWATRAALRRHRWLGRLGIQPVPGPRTLRYGQVATRSFAGLGLDEAAEVSLLAVLNNYISGFLQREAAWRRLGPRADPAVAQASVSPAGMAAPVPAGDAVSTGRLTARLSLHSDESFTFGLDCVLDGIAARIARLAAPPDPPSGG